MSNPIVSIIIPTYKRPQYLEETLVSIMEQTYQDFEVLVIDDGTPNYENEAVCARFDKVKYFKIKNSGGPAMPRNVGILKATGKYIALVDDDDIWLPKKLEIQVAILDENPNFGLVHSCCEVIDENGNLKNSIIGRPGSPAVKHGNVSMRMMGNWTIMMSTPLVRKEIIEKVGLFNEKMPPAGEDVEYWVRCSFFTDFYYIDEPLVHYRIHTNNISTGAKGYMDISLYLKNNLVEFKKRKIINSDEYGILLNTLCGMQIKMLKKNYCKSLTNLFKLKPFWMFRWASAKLFLFILIKR